MRLLLICFLLFIWLPVGAQQRAPFLFTKDSVSNQSPKWLFVDGDRPEYALPAFDDYTLQEVSTSDLRSKGGTPSPFKGIGWLRLRFRVDTGLAGKPLAFSLSQVGASETYLDGKSIYTRGFVGDAAHAKYYDPQHYPVAITVPDTLLHLLAIRYANWNYNNHGYLYDGESPGFDFKLGPAQSAVDNYVTNNDFSSLFCCILFGIFFILAILHFLFFLYYRRERSNLWFSLFAASMALLLMLPYASRTVSSPRLELAMSYYSFFLAVLMCFSLSGFLAQLFSRRRPRFIIVSVFYALCCLGYIFIDSLQTYLIIGVIAVAITETIVVIIMAIIRRVPGARIIGAGLCLFVLMLLFVFITAITGKSLHISLTGTKGIFIFGLVCIALLSIPVSLSAYLAYNFANVSRSLKQRLREVEALSAKTQEQEAEKQRILQSQNEMLEREVGERTREVLRQKTEIEGQHAALMEEKKKGDDLLRNILPAEVAEELKQKGTSAARHYEEVSVLFTDMVDFTSLAEQLDAQELVRELNECFTAFDQIIERNGLEKIKTIGDAYMAVCGLPQSDARHAHKTVQAALEIRDFVGTRMAATHPANAVFPHRTDLQIRIGIHSGPVVAGIIGVKKFAYDIWGDTVNTAARMEQHGEAGRLNISSATYALIKDAFICTPRGKVVAKNKGEIEMYFVEAAAEASL